MKQNYQYCLTQLLKDEGGYTNNPNDKGGPTNFGITLADYRLYINPEGTAEDVKEMTVEQAKLIYKTKYWDKMKCDTLPSGVDYVVFDYGVNSGIARAKQVLAKFSNITDVSAKINSICDERLAFLKSIRGGSDWTHFGKGWSTRVANVRSKSLTLAKTPLKGSTVATGALIASGGAGVAVSHVHHSYWPWIFGAIFVSAALGFVIYTIKEFNKGTK